jgi:glycosyltransferase involved in cell wall biosynthesis
MVEYYPFVSVVICSKGRHNLLTKSVENVNKCNYPEDKREIVVVEEGEKPEPIKGVKYVYLKLENRGLGYCHNQGLKNCSGDIIAFTDDDVKVDENWLKEIVTPFVDKEIYGVAGLVRAQKGNLLGETEEILGLPGGGLWALERSKEQIVPTGLLSTCNLAYKKEVFKEFSFIEESFGKYGGDDWYLGKQVSEKYKCIFNPKAIVYHKPRANIFRLIHTYYRRQITDYLGKRDLYHENKIKAIFGKKHQCVIFKILLGLGIIVIYHIYGLVFLVLFYYLLSIFSARSLFKFVDSKISYFLYPFVKFITELGILKGEILILFSSEESFQKILEKY